MNVKTESCCYTFRLVYFNLFFKSDSLDRLLQLQSFKTINLDESFETVLSYLEVSSIGFEKLSHNKTFKANLMTKSCLIFKVRLVY